MILPFSTLFKDGTETMFVQKIWNSIPELEEFDTYMDWYVKQPFSLKFDETLAAKRHSIREDKHDRWHAGRLIHPVINNRSKNQLQFAPTMPCISTQKIEIKYTNSNSDYPCVKIDERLFYVWIKPDLQVLETLAKNDGFNSVEDFFAWFNDDYSGKIIHWTNLKY